MSDTDTDEENSLKELMELEIRTKRRLVAQEVFELDDEDAWEDESEEDRDESEDDE